MPADAFIQCRVTSETKALVRMLAGRKGITESTLVRQLLEVVLRTAPITDLLTPAPPARINRGARLYVRLAPEDCTLLKERATSRGMPPATYVSVLVRSHLRGVAPIPKAEYLAFKQSISELGTVGRNLNQIARAINQGGRPDLPGRDEVLTMLKVAEALRDHFKGLLRATPVLDLGLAFARQALEFVDQVLGIPSVHGRVSQAVLEMKASIVRSSAS